MVSRRKHVANVTFGDASLTPCTNVSFGVNSDQIEGSGDESQSLRYIGVTNLSVPISIATYNLLSSTASEYFDVGDRDGIGFTAPFADTPSSGASLSSANCLCIGMGGEIAHKGLATVTYDFLLYSTAGDTAPYTVTDSVAITPTTAQETDFFRDIISVVFTPVSTTARTLSGTLSCSWKVEATSDTDSTDADYWITGAWVHGRSVRASLKVRDLQFAHGSTASASTIAFGEKGTLVVKAGACSSETGLIGTTGKQFSFSNMVRIASDGGAAHNEKGEYTLEFRGHGTAAQEATCIITDY